MHTLLSTLDPLKCNITFQSVLYTQMDDLFYQILQRKMLRLVVVPHSICLVWNLRAMGIIVVCYNLDCML